MSKKLINPDSLAAPVGFNHGILVSGGRLLFLAGQTALDAHGAIVAPGDIVAQYDQILRNHQAVVEAAGGAMTDIVKMTIFTRDRDLYLANLKPIGKVHRRYFGSYFPTMAMFEITGFFQREALLELDGIAVIGVDDAT